MAGTGQAGQAYCPACLYLLRSLVWADGGPEVVRCYEQYLASPQEEWVSRAIEAAEAAPLQAARARAGQAMSLRWGRRHPLQDRMQQVTNEALAQKQGGATS